MQQHKRRRKGGLIHYPVLILFSVFFVGMFLLDCVTPTARSASWKTPP